MTVLRCTDVRAALASRRRQRGFFTMPGGMGSARPAGGGGGGGGGGSHRYWRINDMLVDGSVLELSEWRLMSASLDITQIAYSSSSAPGFGALANLFGSTNTQVYWSAAVAEDGAFYIQIDFKAPRAIDGVKLAGVDTSNRYPTQFTLAYSDDGSSFTDQATVTGLTYPGNGVLSSTYDLDGGGTPTAHRYWRLKGFQVDGSFLELARIQMFIGAVLQLNVISASNSPTSPTNLVDNNLSNSNSWSAATVETSGFWIKYDFAAPVTVDAIKLGGFDNSTRYPTQVRLQYSDDDSAWTTLGSASGLSYPGNNTLSAAITF